MDKHICNAYVCIVSTKFLVLLLCVFNFLNDYDIDRRSSLRRTLSTYVASCVIAYTWFWKHLTQNVHIEISVAQIRCEMGVYCTYHCQEQWRLQGNCSRVTWYFKIGVKWCYRYIYYIHILYIYAFLCAWYLLFLLNGICSMLCQYSVLHFVYLYSTALVLYTDESSIIETPHCRFEIVDCNCQNVCVLFTNHWMYMCLRLL